MITKRKKADPLTVAVLDSRFKAITDEIAAVLFRTSRSLVIAEARDFAISIFDKDLRLIVQKEYIPLLAGANSVSIRYIAGAYKGNINEGDVFIHNDSYAGNTHLGDLNIAKPVFYKGELMLWCMVKAHMSDTGNKGVGGIDPTSTTIWQDGVIIPAIKLFEGGKLNTGVRALYLRNIKLPELVWDDIMCEVGAVTVADRSFVAMLRRYSPETVYEAIDEILTSSEREMREIIRQIPDGVYYGEKSTDHDGIDRDKPVTARVKITVKGDELVVDFSNSDPTVRGYINGTEATTFSACHQMLAYTLPGTIKRNEGSMVPVTIINPEGTWLNPTFPASVARATTIECETVAEAMLMALSKAIPSLVTAGHNRISQHVCSGFNPRTGRQWVDFDFFVSFGASGGTEGYDGWDLGGSFTSLGQAAIPDIEMTELVKPLHILQYEQEPDTAGAGKFRSGLGHIYKTQYLVDSYDGAAVAGAGMKDYSIAKGLFGGKGPKLNTVIVHRADGTTEKVDVHTFVKVYAGDIREGHLGGAGGFGDPFERDIEKVKDDVRNEVISVEGAKRDYGVVIDPVTREVDLKATGELRRAHKEALLGDCQTEV